jgi:VanZ family protein
VSERALGLVSAVLALCWATLIAWASHQSNPFPHLPAVILAHDKLLHAAVFGVLAGLTRGALRLTPLPPLRALLLAWVLSTGWGLLDEFHQSFIPNRDADPWDVAADGLGAAAGAWLAAAGLRRVGSGASIRA